MEYKTTKRLPFKVSVVGFGCWAIGGRQWGPVDDTESIAAIERAVEVGINFFDTADVYGLGHSEELLGKALSRRDDVIIATKVGLAWNSKGKIRHDLSKRHIKTACENSLRRLKREAVDLYQLHWPDPAVSLEESVEALVELVEAGKIRFAGACNLSLDDLKTLSAYPWFAAYQGLYNRIDRTVEAELIPFCRREKIAFIAYEPLAKGLLTGKFKKPPVFPLGDHRKYEQRFTTSFFEYKAKVAESAEEAAALKLTCAQTALSWLLSKGATTVIPGMKTVAQVEENALWLDQ